MNIKKATESLSFSMEDNKWDGLRYDALLARQAGQSTPDDLLKWALLRNYARTIGKSWRNFCAFSIMFDDNKNVIKGLTSRGLRVYNALSINERLSA